MFPVVEAFAKIVKTLPAKIAACQECLKIVKDKGKPVRLEWHRGTLTDEEADLLKRRLDRATDSGKRITAIAWSEFWAYCMYLGEGPKVFEPTDDDCTALSDIEAGISFAQYEQPFPAYAVKLPERWSENHQIVKSDGSRFTPSGVIIAHHRESRAIICTVMFREAWQMMTYVLVCEAGSLDTGSVEEALDKMAIREIGTFQSDGVEALAHKIVRVCVNASLFLMDRGTRVSGPSRPEQRRRLERYVKVAEKAGDTKRLEDARHSLAAEPMRIEMIHQTVTISHSTYGGTERTGREGQGPEKSPHWRSAHWRMQRVGHGRTEVKRVLVSRCFVRGDRFAGSIADTEYVKRGSL